VGNAFMFKAWMLISSVVLLKDETAQWRNEIKTIFKKKDFFSFYFSSTPEVPTVDK
jgi:hypothetical protein